MRWMVAGLTLLHGMRLMGMKRVAATAAGALPPINYILGFGDTLAGLCALALGLALLAWGLTPRLRRLAVAWNLFGAADLALALAVELITHPADPNFYKPVGAAIFMTMNLAMLLFLKRRPN